MTLRTGHFLDFYDRVEKALLDGTTGRTRFVFHRLIEGFRVEFTRWRIDPLYPLIDSLIEIDRADDLSRLIGFAYIHMAFDLPRVISRHLSQLIYSDALVPWLDDAATAVTAPNARLDEIWRTFIKADLILVQAFTSQLIESELLPLPVRFGARQE